MRQNTAPGSLSIKIITSLILILTIVIVTGAFYINELIWAGLILTIVVLYCYISSPVSYELNADQLIVKLRKSNKIFAPVVNCSSIHGDKPSFSIRMWGNGGLFAATGIFWNRKYGIFRAYVTTGDKSYFVLVETPDSKIIITPEEPDKFISFFNSQYK